MTLDIGSLYSRVNYSNLSPDDFLERFQHCGFLWFRDESSVRKLPSPQDIIDFLKEHASPCQKSWTVENQGDCNKESLPTPLSLASTTNESFYVSTIVHREDDSAFQSFTQNLPKFEVFDDLHFTSGAWLFLGHPGAGKKRKRNMVGRAEHVDEVTHSGTFHIQVAGNKVWWIRPHPELFGDELPDLSTIPGAEKSETTKSWRLKVEVEEGDIFVLNTKIWYHYTELPPSEWSISIAHDFFLPIPSPENFSEGDVIYDEDEIPDEMPRSDSPNCAMAEVEGDDDADEIMIVLVALQSIREGDFLSVGHDREGDDLCNSKEMVDPRAVATRDYEKGQTVLQADDIPHELPRSLEPNCELIENEVDVSLRALSAITEGSVLCILPNEDEEYEEVEVDLATGELQRDGA